MTTLLDEIIKNISSTNNNSIPNYNFTEEQLVFIKMYVNTHPEIFEQITMKINEVLDDGKLDIHDIPNIVFIISNLYNNNAVYVEAENIDNILSFIKFTIDTLLNSDLVMLPNIEKQVIIKIVDSSIDLLKFSISTVKDVEENVSCTGILSVLFRKNKNKSKI